MATLDDLDARLRALEAARPDPRAAVPPIRIGELTDVPTPGSTISSAWSQEVTNRIAQRFANPAARDTNWPAATAGAGAVCVTVDTFTVWTSTGAVWLPAGPRLVGATTGSGFGSVTAASDITGTAITFSAIAGRRYMARGSVSVLQLSANGTVNLIIADAANAALVSTAQTLTVGDYGVLFAEVVWPAPAAQSMTLKLRVSTSSGAVSSNSQARFSVTEWAP